MKRYVLFFTLTLLVVSCKKENPVEDKVAGIPAEKVDIVRFDNIFYDAKPQDLPKVKAEFPYLFPEGNEDAVWLDKMKDPFLQELHKEVNKKFPDTKALSEDLSTLFQHIKYYYPQFTNPKVITIVSEDDESKVILAENKMFIPLALYLGKDNKLYEGFDNYRKQEMEPSQILPDAVNAFSYGKIAPPKDRSLLDIMVYFGKQLYIKDRLIPDVADEHKIGYTKQQLDWCAANEAEMWKYFVENKLLYDTDPKLPGRFVNPAPFSKFYLEIDNDSPGRTGQWLGWQIVRAYMDNNKAVTLQQLLAMDAKTIFDNSKYKPKK